MVGPNKIYIQKKKKKINRQCQILYYKDSSLTITLSPLHTDTQLLIVGKFLIPR